MGSDPKRDEPFFFMKPNDALVVSEKMGAEISVPYPPMTRDFHFELELVACLASGGAAPAILGYALGLDMTRRDLQKSFKDKGQPWDMAKGFDRSAPISPIVLGDIGSAEIALTVNGILRQKANIADMIWNTQEVIAKLSNLVELQPGDLIFTGTPEGVGAVSSGDQLSGQCGRLRIEVRIA